MIAVLKIVWLAVSGILFWDTFKHDGLLRALLNWVNPITPP